MELNKHMQLLASYLFILGLALGAACGSDNKSGNEQETPSATETTSREPLQQNQPESNNHALQSTTADTLYRVSGTEPFWSLVVAKPQMAFTSAEGDTLFFPYQEPLQASARPEGYVQVYDLGKQQQLILQHADQCPCSDGMSGKEYPYRAVLVLENKVLEGCGRTP